LSSRRCSTGSALSIDKISESFYVPNVVDEAVKQEEGDLIYGPAEKSVNVRRTRTRTKLHVSPRLFGFSYTMCRYIIGQGILKEKSKLI
jgi:hypothetical protein